VPGEVAMKTIGPGQMQVELPLADLLLLERTADRIPGTDPASSRWHEVCESLAPIVYGLILED
jgi:hypothetical protein